MMRSIGAVIAGFLLWTVLWLGSNSLLTVATPDSFKADGSTDSVIILLLLLVLSVLFSLAAGYVAARVARYGSMIPVWLLGLFLLAVGLFVQLSFWSLFPLWYNLLFLVLLVPATVIGARMYGGAVGDKN